MGDFEPFCLRPYNDENPANAGLSSYSGVRIRTCDLRVMSLIRWIGWTTGSAVQSGFREIELLGDRLESVGLVAPFVAPLERVPSTWWTTDEGGH
jgi:hypothetical protein